MRANEHNTIDLHSRMQVDVRPGMALPVVIGVAVISFGALAIRKR
jgi:hypothetical protein